MAIRRVVASDLSGQLDAATVTFSFGDAAYEVDLTDEEKRDLERSFQRSLEPYIKVGRKVDPPRVIRDEPKTTAEERVQIRAWAREQNLEVTDFGRIPAKIIYAYRDAHEDTFQRSLPRDEPKTTANERAKIRAWAREQNLEVAPSGRIPAKIVYAYRDAHEDN